MKLIRTTLSTALILYLCASLSGVPMVLTASAHIKPKPESDFNHKTKLYTIKKGDYLHKLAGEIFNNERTWREFLKYNSINHPNLIYQGELMRVPTTWPVTPLAPPVVMPDEFKVTPQMLQEIKDLLNKRANELDARLAKLEREAQARAASTIIGPSDPVDLKPLEDRVGRLEGDVRNLDSKVTGLGAEVDKANRSIGELQAGLGETNTELARQQTSINGINDSIKDLSAKIDLNQKAIEELRRLHDREKDEIEEPNKSKRTTAILAAIAGGVAWFAVNAVGRGD